jgi:hypothetical protein
MHEHERFGQKELCESSFSDKFGSLGAHIMLAWESYLNLSCWVENDWMTRTTTTNYVRHFCPSPLDN